MLPKVFIIQIGKKLAVLFSFPERVRPWMSILFRNCDSMLVNPGYWVHLFSNLKDLYPRMNGVREIKKWDSGQTWGRWDGIACGSQSTQSMTCWLRSNLSGIQSSPCLQLFHVYLCPVNPMSSRGLLWMKSLNALAVAKNGSGLPPSFSGAKILFRSPTRIQGICLRVPQLYPFRRIRWGTGVVWLEHI